MKRRNFIKGLTLSSAIAVLLYSGYSFDIFQRHERRRNILKHPQNIPYIKHIDIDIVEHCYLNCKHCDHFSTIAEKEFYNVDKYEKDIKRLAYITKQRIEEIGILGGEPLTHPDLTKILDITRNYFPKNPIIIFTNGTMLAGMPASFWEALKRNKIILNISIYLIDIKMDKIKKLARKYNIEYWLDDSRIFDKTNLDLTGSVDINERFKKCTNKNNCTSFINGKFYPCNIIGNIRHFNKRFNQHLDLTPKDYLDIYEANNIDEILDFLSKPAPFCRYCKEVNKCTVPWETSADHGIEEWT